MSAETIRYLIIGIVGGTLLVFLAIQPILRKYKSHVNDRPESDYKNVTCELKTCSVYYKRANNNSRYCDFHTKVQEIHLQLVELESPYKKRAEVYLHTNGEYYKDSYNQTVVFNELEKLLKDEKKKLKKASASTTKTKKSTKKTTNK